MRQGINSLSDCGMNLKLIQCCVPTDNVGFAKDLILPPEAEKRGAVLMTQM
jgi:hypothetical protein